MRSNLLQNTNNAFLSVSKISKFQDKWYMFKNLRDGKGRLLSRFVRRAKLREYIKAKRG